MTEPGAHNEASKHLVVGRYALFDELAAGGMATVHLGRLLVEHGEGRTVAIKRLHDQYTRDPEFCAMFLDEARLVTRIRHPNCVRTVDVVKHDEALYLVMEYVHGESLSRLLRACREKNEQAPPRLAATLLHGVLLGLHAAHDATGADGEPLGVVHRDVSPQNVIVGVDGMAKVLDFGIAKAAGRMQTTREGQIKGKLTYMAPEQIRGQVDRRTDVFAASIVLWEALAGRRMHEGLKDVEIVTRVVQGKFVPPSTHAPDIAPELDAIVLKGLAPEPRKRYASALEMASDIEKHVGLIPRGEIGEWVDRLAKSVLDKRAAKVAAMEAAAGEMRPSASAARLPMMSALDPLGAAVVEGSTEQKVQDELDAVASTAAVAAYKPDAGVVAAAVVPAAPPPSPPSPVPADTGHSLLTPSGTELPPVGPRPRLDAKTLAMFAACVFVGLTGLGLGGYALTRPSAPPAEAPAASSVGSVRSQEPTPPATPMHEEAPAPSATTAPADKALAPATPVEAGAGATASAARPSPPRAPLVRPKPKPDCDPPYVIEPSGEKRFKTECMGL